MMNKTFNEQVKKDVRIKGERISFRLTEREKYQLKLMMEASGFNNITDFIRFRIFDKEHNGVAITNMKKYWDKVNHYMKKIERDTLIYEQQSCMNTPLTKDSHHEK